MQKSVAIIGGSGFLGINIANYLMTKGYRILIIARNFDRIKYYSNGDIEFYTIDVNETSKLFDKITDFDKIIWLINNQTPSGTQMDSLIDDFTFNISPLIKFFELLKERAFKMKIIYLSSGGSIYGNSYSKIPFTEKDYKNPISSYGLIKLISEKYLRYLVNNSNIDCTILRPSNVYGKFQNLNKPQGIVGFAFKSLILEERMVLFNNGNIVRDFLFVDDLSFAIHLCLEVHTINNSVNTYNVGSGSGISMTDLVKKISLITGQEMKILNKPSRSYDCNFNVLNTEKIKKDINWYPKVKLNEGLDLVWSWMRNMKY